MLSSLPTKIPWSVFGLNKHLQNLRRIRPKILFLTWSANVAACSSLKRKHWCWFCQQIPGKEQNQQSFSPSFNTSLLCQGAPPLSLFVLHKLINLGWVTESSCSPELRRGLSNDNKSGICGGVLSAVASYTLGETPFLTAVQRWYGSAGLC